MNKKRNNRLKPKKHPMWIFVFLLLGIALSLLFVNIIPIICFIAIGIFFYFNMKITPSQAIRFNKTEKMSFLVWIIILLTSIILIFLFVFMLITGNHPFLSS